MMGGKITRNDRDGGVLIDGCEVSGGKLAWQSAFIMKGGAEVCGNTAGGGLYINGGGHVEMHGEAVLRNTGIA